MDKKLFSDLISSVREAGRIGRGEIKAKRVHEVDTERIRSLRIKFKPTQIVKIRHRMGLSQAEFARIMLIPKATLQSWEQGRRHPEGPAIVLIQVMMKNPDAVVQALHAS
jgi:putative transcriptional regulator